jgi:hypothetical protein
VRGARRLFGSRVRRTVLGAASLVVAACHPPLTPLAPTLAPGAVNLCEGACKDSITVTYLGTSGFVFRGGPLGDSALMTDPTMTHQRLAAVALPFWPVHSDVALIDSLLAHERLDNVSGILIGHSHYDHLLDVPYVARTKATAAVIYGSPTMANILAAVPELRGRTRAIAPDSVGTAAAVGRWYPLAGGHARFMALASSHAPNIGFLRYTYANATESSPRSELPRTTHGWVEGEVYAYLIDLLDSSGAPVFRIFFQDAAAEPEYSVLPPLASQDQRAVDVAIICAGNFGNAQDYPSALLRNIRPKHVIVSHWEDFFEHAYPPIKGISFTDTKLLESRLRIVVGDRWVTPEPMARITYRY